MKQRFSSLDVRVIAHELALTLPTLRVSNIYDLSTRIFLLKFTKPGSPRHQLLVDSGFRCHLTSFQRTAASAPSAFVTRLRKYLKSRRVTGVKQVGTDRVIEIEFSEGRYRLFLEFFAGGNVVLTDVEYNVLALLREVHEGNEEVDIKLGGRYNLEPKQNYHGIPELTLKRVKTVLEEQREKMRLVAEVGGKKAKRHKGGDEVGKALSVGFAEYPAHLIDHAFKVKEVDGAMKIDEVLGDEELLGPLMGVLGLADEVFRQLGIDSEPNGYIVARVEEKKEIADDVAAPEGTASRDDLLYEDFHPFRPSQFDDRPGTKILEIVGFNKTVDEFYSSIESQKLESRLTEREQAAKRKLETAKAEHEKRLGALQHVQELHIRKAQAIEANTHRVEEAIAAVNGLIGQGMDWMDIGKLIENEQGRGNVVAQMVKLPLKLYENTVTLLLDEPGTMEEDDDDDLDEGYNSEDENLSDEDDNTLPAPQEKKMAIDIDLALSPWANARQYYDQKKTAAVKEQKTIQASTRALKSTEKKIEADLKKGLKTEKATLRPARRQFFWEKFLWFISSDGYLVMGGKDANQNEMLYRRYLTKGDVYVHADLTGAASVVVKNKAGMEDSPVPPSTLSQAGALTVCTSVAWDSKAVMSAWWVHADQVSKTVESTGQFLSKEGDFVVKGTKNFLPPSQLLLGFAVTWIVSEESRQNHGKLRIQDEANGESEGMARGMSGLSLREDGDEDIGDGEADVVPDVEDAANLAETEMEPDNATDEESEDNDDGRESVVASEAGDSRGNPLQVNGTNASNDDDAKEPEQSKHELEPDVASHHDAGHLDVDDEEASINRPTADTVATTAPSAPSDTDSTTPSTSSRPTAPSSTPNSRPPPRGKQTKAARRAAAKYANQDAEDRELAMQLLGSAKATKQKADADSEKREREEKLARDKERRRAQHDKAAKAEQARRTRLDAGGTPSAGTTDDVSTHLIEQDASILLQETADFSSLDLLLPYLHPSDTLLSAIPVCAPWSALSRHKYKAKLQPGSLKKGKAVREIIGAWTGLATRGPKVVDMTSQDRERVWLKEVEMIKHWRVEECVGILPVKGVRVVQSGGGSAGGGQGKGKAGGSGARGGRGSKKTR